MRWFLLLIISASAVWAQFPLPMPTRPTSFPLQRPTTIGVPVVWGATNFGVTSIPAGLTNTVQLSVGYGRAAALRSDGTVLAWGSNTAGSGWSNVAQISIGPFGHIAAVLIDGSVATEGVQYTGSHAVPIPVGLSNVVQIDVGYATTAALKSDGTVVVWGRNEFGECNVPAGLSNVVQVTAGNAVTVALKADGTVAAWGLNNYGRIDAANSVTGAVSVVADGGHIIALKGDGSVIAWGQNDVGQATVPNDLNGVVRVAAGYDEGVALRANGAVRVWGYGYQGQTNVPTNVVKAIQIDAAYGNAAALLAQPASALEVLDSVGLVLSNNANAISLPTLLGNVSDAQIYTVRNSGDADLSDIVFGMSGADSSHFLLAAPTTNSLAPGSSTTFSVSFAPTSSGSRTAQLSITSNDTNNSPFIINLSGFGLGEDLDSDSDGLNDAAEYLLRDLGFEWGVSQPGLVATLFDNAAAAGLYSSNHVVSNPSDFGLFTEQQQSEQFETGRAAGEAGVIESPAAFGLFNSAQYEAHRVAGQLDVVAEPARFNLYDSESIMDLRMGGLMVSKEGSVATVVFQPQTTTDLATQPFTNNGAAITNHFIMPERRAFMRIQAQPTLTPPAP